MADSPRPIPTLCPTPEYDNIRNGDKDALETALRNIVKTLNTFILKKGG